MMWKFHAIRYCTRRHYMIGWAASPLAGLLACVCGLDAAQPVVQLFTTEDGLVRNWVAVRTCTVSFTDAEGLRHSVNVRRKRCLKPRPSP
jgi:hypothetical protein